MAKEPMITVRITPEEHRAFKMACAKFGTSMSDVLRAAIRQAIEAARQQGGEEE